MGIQIAESLAKYRKSVYFFALHKGGSSIIGTVLGDAGQQHIDYAAQIYHGHKPDLVFPKRGHVIGPLRLSRAGELIGEEAHLVGLATRPGFLKDKRYLVMIRDPRDILVSAYFSFGFSHGLSDNPEIRKDEIETRDRIQQLTLDQYAIEYAPQWAETFDRVTSVLAESRRSGLLTYEEMVLDFPRFARKLKRFLPLSKETLEILYRNTRPREAEALGHHKRSGRVGEFREKLQPATIEQINGILARSLDRYGYS